MADKKEHIERGELIDFLKREIMQCENDLADSYGDDRYEQAVDSRMIAFWEVLHRFENKPAADVVSLDDVRKAFENYILEMTCSKYGTPQETQFARDIVRQAVNIVLGERKEQT